jgi:hypothetical protein
MSVIALSLTVAPQASTSASAVASASLSGSADCGTGWNGGWTGYELPQFQSGLRAGVGHDRPYLCNSPPSGDTPRSLPWTMIDNGSGCANCNLAQSGWAVDAAWGTNVYFFYECADDASQGTSCLYLDGAEACACIQQFGLMQNPLQRSYYDQFDTHLDSSDAHEVHMEISPTGDPNGTPYSVTLKINWSVNDLEAFAEVWNRQTQTTGTTENPNYFQNIQFLRSGTWAEANLNSGNWLSSTSSYGKTIIGSNTEFAVEDTRY